MHLCACSCIRVAFYWLLRYINWNSGLLPISNDSTVRDTYNHVGWSITTDYSILKVLQHAKLAYSWEVKLVRQSHGLPVVFVKVHCENIWLGALQVPGSSMSSFTAQDLLWRKLVCRLPLITTSSNGFLTGQTLRERWHVGNYKC